jgi:uncharacterized protein YraI
MQFKNTIFIAAMTAAAALSVPASAATLVSAITPLNIRTGPGPQYGTVGAIPDRGQAVILGCIQGSLWCEVSYNGRQGWVYSQYLTASLSGRSMIVAEHLNDVAPAVSYRASVEVVGSAPPPAITGTLVARPATAQPLVIAPPPTVRSYVAMPRRNVDLLDPEQEPTDEDFADLIKGFVEDVMATKKIAKRNLDGLMRKAFERPEKDV